MSNDDVQLQVVTASVCPKIVIYGPPGLGKTSLAAQFPDPIFVQLEMGVPKGYELISFGLLDNKQKVFKALKFLEFEDHPFKTLVIDSVDKFESIISQDICQENGWPSISHPGWGKGTDILKVKVEIFLAELERIRKKKGMTIIFICHSKVERFEDPLTQSYNKYDLNLNEKVRSVLYSECDVVLFLNKDADSKPDPSSSRVIADGSNRFIHCEASPAFIAKNRYDMPKKILYQIHKGYEEISKYVVSNPNNGKKEDDESSS